LSWDWRARAWLTRPAARGRVVAVASRAVHVEAPDGSLLCIADARTGDAPLTLRVALPPGAAFAARGLAVGAPAAVRGTTLLLGGLPIQLDAPRAWAQGGRPAAPVPAERLRRGVALLARASRVAARRDGLYPAIAHLDALLAGATPAELDLLARRAWPPLLGIVAAWRAGDGEALATAPRGLVGLGPGATPSGDDLLAGLLVGARRGLRALGREEAAVDRLAAGCLALVGETTRLAGARLRCAAADELDEALDAVFPPVYAAHGRCAWLHAARAAELGHSSGTDTLAGVLLGLSLAAESCTTCCEPQARSR
jgi:hypothetical protein